jgi:hypothetical protein
MNNVRIKFLCMWTTKLNAQSDVDRIGRSFWYSFKCI